RAAGSRRRGGYVGAAADDSPGDPADAQAAHHGGAAVSAELTVGGRVPRRPNYRLRRNLTEAAALAFAVVIAVWTLTPIYNIVAVALGGDGDAFPQRIW